MAFTTRPGEQYTIRRRVLKIFGAGFHIYAPDGSVCAYCKQKALRLREDLRVYTDDSLSEELFRIGTEHIIDFGATYRVMLPTGEPIGSCRRKALRSFLRDTWLVFDDRDNEIAVFEEESSGKAVARRLLGDYAFMMPQCFNLKLHDGTTVATFRTHFNPIVHRLSITIYQEHEQIDDLMLLAAGVLIMAIEGRQG